MNSDRFICLDPLEQMEVFWSGVFVGELSEGEFKMVCHQVDDFYVEYKILGGHYLDLYVFKDPHMIEAYLNQVAIPNL
jgi:hypothetical protein